MKGILSAAPKPLLQGVKDASGGTLPVIPEQIPTHLPHIYLYTRKGPLEPQLVVGSSLIDMYGAESFDYRGKYANHQTVLANTVNGNGNAMIVQRMKPADADPEATLTLALDIVQDQIPEYQREADGSLSLDENGDPIDLGTTVDGYRAMWVVSNSIDGTIGGASSQAGSLTGTDGASQPTTSTIYPIMDLKVSSFGEHGNLKGIRLWAPTTGTNPAINEDVVTDQNSFLFRIQMIERPDSTTQPNVIETKMGAQSLEFSFKDGAMNTAVDQDLFIDNILLDAYRNLDAMPKQYGPFNDMHVYHDNLQTVLDMIYATEQPNQPEWPATAAEGRYLINLLSAKDTKGYAYYTFAIDGSAAGGVDFTTFSNHYAAGGSDGTMDFASFDALVQNELKTYGTSSYDLLDTAMWPQSAIYDTGFTLATKKAMLTPIGLRKDMMVILSTQDVSQPQNDAASETSTAIALRAAARLYPESEVFGTPVCRAIVVGHSGYLVNSQYKGLLPLTIELANKASKFMGAGDGVWKRDRGFDTPPYNQVTQFKDVNCVYKDAAVYEADWANGLTWVQRFDRRSLFFPAMQTVYDDSTSVLNSVINAFIIVEIEKVAERTWRMLTGTSKLTREQFIERSNLLIEDAVKDRFDGRVRVVPNTYFTTFDEALGYSWSTDITLYLNNMMSVGTFTIIAKRTSDFAG